MILPPVAPQYPLLPPVARNGLVQHVGVEPHDDAAGVPGHLTEI
jgi:hypothetical protein